MIFNSITLELFLDHKNITNKRCLFKADQFQSVKILLSLKLNNDLTNIFNKEKLLMGDMFLINNNLYIFHQKVKKIHKPEDVGLLDGFTFYELTNITNHSLPHLKIDVVYNKLKQYKDDSLLYALDKGEDISLIYIGNIYFDFETIVEKISFKYNKNKQLIDNNLIFYMGFFNTYKNKLEFFMNNERCNIRYYEKKENFKRLHTSLMNKEPYSFKSYIPELKKIVLSSSFLKSVDNKLLFFGFNDYGHIDFFNRYFPKGFTYSERKELPTYNIDTKTTIITIFDKKEYYEEILELIRD